VKYAVEPYSTLSIRKETASDTSNTYIGGKCIVEKEQERDHE